MGISYEKLRQMSEDELIQKSNEHMEFNPLPAHFFLDELHRRQLQEHSRTIRNLTWAITIMTVVITVATIVNVSGG